MDRDDDLFFLTFVGEWVEIMTRLNLTTPDNVIIPLSIEGYFLEYDEKYYYLGEGANQINRAIKIEDVIDIKISNPKTKYDTMLDNFEPEKEEDIN